MLQGAGKFTKKWIILQDFRFFVNPQDQDWSTIKLVVSYENSDLIALSHISILLMNEIRRNFLNNLYSQPH